MADKQISQLPEATAIGDADLLVISQGGTAKQLPASTLKGIALGDAVTDIVFTDAQQDGNIVISVVKGGT